MRTTDLTARPPSRWFTATASSQVLVAAPAEAAREVLNDPPDEPPNEPPQPRHHQSQAEGNAEAGDT